MLRASPFTTQLSQRCFCGGKVTKTLADRIHTCPACGLAGDARPGNRNDVVVFRETLGKNARRPPSAVRGRRLPRQRPHPNATPRARRPHHQRPQLPPVPQTPSRRRTHHRPTQRPPDLAPMPTPRRRVNHAVAGVAALHNLKRDIR
jgi:hypothetical protein